MISPELTKAGEGEITQSTEAVIGPLELHEFFLHRLLRWGDAPAKIDYLAKQVFSDYQPQIVEQWLNVFLQRFTRAQFKRDNLPNGPKVGSVCLSPRGDWRMPSDLYNDAVWR